MGINRNQTIKTESTLSYTDKTYQVRMSLRANLEHIPLDKFHLWRHRLHWGSDMFCCSLHQMWNLHTLWITNIAQKEEKMVYGINNHIASYYGRIGFITRLDYDRNSGATYTTFICFWWRTTIMDTLSRDHSFVFAPGKTLRTHT